MYPFDKKGLLRTISVKLLFNFFYWTGLSANSISILNFLILNVLTIVFFAIGREYLGLFFALLGAMVDYIDGSIARAGRGHPKGQYLDTSLDWLYLMLLICAIAYHHNIMMIGYLTLVAITFSNWVQYNGFVIFNLPKIFKIEHLLVIGVITNSLEYILTLIMFTQWIRGTLMYVRSLS